MFFIFKGLGVVAGIRGGSITIPLLMYFYGLSLKPATAISSFSILIETISKFITSFNEKNPDKPSLSIIDYTVYIHKN